MAVLEDIPERDGLSAQDQLDLLKSYLRSSEYTDSMLIDLLVQRDAVTIWRDLVGADSDEKPFTYDTLHLNMPVNKIRMLTEDTVESDLKHTDRELLKYLEVIPLRYVVSCIKLEDSTDITLPEDDNHPLTILRKYLQDEDGQQYLDKDLIKMLLESGMNPFGIIIDKINAGSSLSMATSSDNLSGGIASIDGISFNNPTEDSEIIQQNLDSVAAYASRSVYARDSVYAVYQDGENILEEHWKESWYAVY